jgi:hypothetical protein
MPVLGFGFAKEEVEEGDLPVPTADYFGEASEEQLVKCAGKFHTKTPSPRFVNSEEYAEKQRKTGEEKANDFWGSQ